MLKPEFLPFGSIVKFDEDGTICEVKGIDADQLGITVLFHDTQEETWIELSEFSGIPLTPKILTEWCNASEVKPNQYRIGERLFVVRDGKICDYGSSVQVDYLHELQLLFLGFKTVLTVKIK